MSQTVQANGCNGNGNGKGKAHQVTEQEMFEEFYDMEVEFDVFFSQKSHILIFCIKFYLELLCTMLEKT